MTYRGATGSINADPMAVALAADGTLGQVHVSRDEGGARRRIPRAGGSSNGEDIYAGHPVPTRNVEIVFTPTTNVSARWFFGRCRWGRRQPAFPLSGPAAALAPVRIAGSRRSSMEPA